MRREERRGEEYGKALKLYCFVPFSEWLSSLPLRPNITGYLSLSKLRRALENSSKLSISQLIHGKHRTPKHQTLKNISFYLITIKFYFTSLFLSFLPPYCTVHYTLHCIALYFVYLHLKNSSEKFHKPFSLISVYSVDRNNSNDDDIGQSTLSQTI